MKESGFINGGYFIIQEKVADAWMHKNYLPQGIYSASTCICNTIPDSWAIPWVKYDQDKYKNIFDILKLNSFTEINNFQSYFNLLFEKGNFGFPNVFMDKKTLFSFFKNYNLQSIKNIKIIGISLKSDQLASFINNDKKASEKSSYGIIKSLKSINFIDDNRKDLGFEILGYEWGSFHSYICNGLEKDYVDNLKIKLNTFGLITSYEDAILASEYTNSEEAKSEPVRWDPWLLSEYFIG